MKISKKIFFVASLMLTGLMLFTPFNSSKRAPADFSIDGEYTILGTSSEKGGFSGRGWVHNGVVQRKIRYSQFAHNGNAVEAIWSGIVGRSSFDFSLNPSNVLTSFEDYTPKDEEFKTPIKVSLPQSALTSEFHFSLPFEGQISETWSRTKDAEATPLWKDLRYSEQGTGDTRTLIKVINKIVGIEKVIDMYRDLPELAEFRSRPEFQEAKHFFVHDKTDADFYLKNPNVLRITNKTINPLSLAEATMRKNAYGQTLAAKEMFLGNQTRKNNLNAAGFLENAIVDRDGKKISRQTEYDTALWTSMFGWAELMRFQMTHDPEALKNFKTVLDGVLKLVEITGDPHQFARGIAVSPPEEVIGDGWIQGTGEFSHLKWRKGGNNDMIKGVFLTLTLAHQVVLPSEVQLIDRLKKVSKALPLLDAVSDRGYNHGLAKGLEALWNKDEEALEDFSRGVVNLASLLGDASKLGVGLYYGGIADWSGIHLSMISNLCQVLVGRELQTVFPYSPVGFRAKQAQKSGEKRLFEMYKLYKNAHRDFLTIMVYANSEVARKDPEFAAAARDALWTLKEVPAPRSIGNASADLRKQPHWCVSAWPRMPWKVLAGFRKLKENPEEQVIQLLQGAYAYPLFEGTAIGTTYMWKDQPFAYTFASQSNVQTFSSDYLLIYWTGRTSGLLTAED